MTDRPDVVVIMTDQERAVPPYESDELREMAQPGSCRHPVVRRPRGLVHAPLHRLAGLRAQPAHACSPGSTPMYTA